MNSQKFSLFSFGISALFIAFVVGFIVREFQLFPYQFYVEAVKGFEKIRDARSGKLPNYYNRLREPLPNIVNQIDKANKGLTLITKIEAENNIAAEIIDLNGNIVHKWDINWFEMWPDPQHIPAKDIPREKPGAQIHGVVVMENGDLVFNFGKKGLIRINRDSEVVWRLPYMTHHSLHKHDDGNLWVAGRKYHKKRIARLSNIYPPFYEETILEVTPDGEILREWFVADILRDNGYAGLLYLGTLNNESTKIRGKKDILHLNDIEPFPSTLEEGFFEQGDVMVSLRNTNTIFVFNTESNEIKFMSIGQVIRQHDPDFIDGNTFSVFDNNNDSPLDFRRSRIVIFSAIDNSSKVFFEGTREKPFYTHIMGKHQWQPNGNLLITESKFGRGFEINQQGEIIWQYINYIEDGVVGNLSEVQRLPIEYDQVFSLDK